MRIDERPWGRYEVLFNGLNFQVKRIEIKPGSRFSLQKHNRRAEKWIILSGKGLAVVGNKSFKVAPGDILQIPKKCIHRLTNTGKKPLVFVEAQFGTYLEEDDIVRLVDDFGRK